MQNITEVANHSLSYLERRVFENAFLEENIIITCRLTGHRLTKFDYAINSKRVKIANKVCKFWELVFWGISTLSVRKVNVIIKFKGINDGPTSNTF